MGCNTSKEAIQPGAGESAEGAKTLMDGGKLETVDEVTPVLTDAIVQPEQPPAPNSAILVPEIAEDTVGQHLDNSLNAHVEKAKETVGKVVSLEENSFGREQPCTITVLYSMNNFMKAPSEKKYLLEIPTDSVQVSPKKSLGGALF
ncbi:hypothetical protein RUM43_008629 [Polyplax serrata]|uniref:Uncharacterized protein n=1 Tax=Polyplax serrata TaxID=468196 RepID=A0AAN8S0N1_POLSC